MKTSLATREPLAIQPKEKPCATTTMEPASPAPAEAMPKISTVPDGLTLQSLESRVKLVELETPLDSLMNLRENLAFMKGQISELSKQLDAKLIEWINKNGAITIGTRRIFVGEDKSTKCKDVKAAMQALLEASGGDWDQVVQCLSANAIKHGAARTVLEDKWGDHFEVIEKTELKEGVEKPVKQIVDMDTQFIPQRKPR